MREVIKDYPITTAFTVIVALFYLAMGASFVHQIFVH